MTDQGPTLPGYGHPLTCPWCERHPCKCSGEDEPRLCNKCGLPVMADAAWELCDSCLFSYARGVEP